MNLTESMEQALADELTNQIAQHEANYQGPDKVYTHEIANQMSNVFNNEPERLILDPYFLNLDGFIYPTVMDDILELLYERQQRPVNLAIFIEGIGSGKTLKASVILWLLWFELCTYIDPQAHFSLIPGSTIAFMNMSRTEIQARRITFNEVWRRFESPFNKDYFPPAPRFSKEIRIESNQTAIFAGTSSAMSALGYNVYGGSVDEANFLEVVEDSKRSEGLESDTYDAAEDIHNAMMNRMTSRFMKAGEMPCVMVMFSSPRFPDDFLEKKVSNAQDLGDESGIFWKRRPTWSAKGRLFYPSEEYFYVDTETYEIIEEGVALRSPDYKPIEEGERTLTKRIGIADSTKIPSESLYQARKEIIKSSDNPWNDPLVSRLRGMLSSAGQIDPVNIEPCPARNRLTWEIRDGQYKFVQRVKTKTESTHAFMEKLVSLRKIMSDKKKEESATIAGVSRL